MRSCRTSVILAGKCYDNKSRHSNPSFRENVGSGENKSYQMEYLFHIAMGTGDGFTSLDGNKRTNFCGKKKYNHDAVFRGVYQLMNDGQQMPCLDLSVLPRYWSLLT